MSVCLSVCPSHAGIVPNRLHISSFFSFSGSPTILVFRYQTGWRLSSLSAIAALLVKRRRSNTAKCARIQKVGGQIPCYGSRWVVEKGNIEFLGFLSVFIFGHNFADFLNSFTVGLSSKFATRILSYFPPHFKCVTTLSCEIQNINNSNSLDVFNSVT